MTSTDSITISARTLRCIRRTINTEKRIIRVKSRQTKYNEEAIVLLRNDLDAAIDELDLINTLHSYALVTIRDLELEASTLRRSTKKAEERLAERQQYLNAPPKSFTHAKSVNHFNAFSGMTSPER